MQKLNVRIVSFFLILAFSQKMGLELWLHNWLHETTVATSAAPTQGHKPVLQHQVIKCNCIDDALNPLLESDMVNYKAIGRPSLPLFTAIYSSWRSIDKEFSSLRGPPVAPASL